MRTQTDQLHAIMRMQILAPVREIEAAREVPGQVQSVDVRVPSQAEVRRGGQRLEWLRQWFLRGARIMSQLDHPTVAGTYATAAFAPRPSVSRN